MGRRPRLDRHGRGAPGRRPLAPALGRGPVAAFLSPQRQLVSDLPAGARWPLGLANGNAWLWLSVERLAWSVAPWPRTSSSSASRSASHPFGLARQAQPTHVVPIHLRARAPSTLGRRQPDRHPPPPPLAPSAPRAGASGAAYVVGDAALVCVLLSLRDTMRHRGAVGRPGAASVAAVLAGSHAAADPGASGRASSRPPARCIAPAASTRRTAG